MLKLRPPRLRERIGLIVLLHLLAMIAVILLFLEQTDMRKMATAAERALEAIGLHLGELEAAIGLEPAANVVHSVKIELLDMKARAFFGIGAWKRCVMLSGEWSGVRSDPDASAALLGSPPDSGSR